MSLTTDQILHIAQLARLKLTEDEVDIYTHQLAKILDYMNILNEVDTSQIEPTYQVTGLESVMEDDAIKYSISSNDDLLHCTGLPVEGNQIRVRSVIE